MEIIGAILSFETVLLIIVITRFFVVSQKKILDTKEILINFAIDVDNAETKEELRKILDTISNVEDSCGNVHARVEFLEIKVKYLVKVIGLNTKERNESSTS